MDHGFPNSVTTTVTVVTTENTSVNRTLRYDKSVIKSIPGIIKIAEIVLNLLGFICIMAANIYTSRGQWFNTVAMGGLWMSLIILVLYVFHVVEKFYKIPWLKIEFVLYVVWCVLYLIAASLVAHEGRISEAYGVAAFFGFIAIVVYGYDAWLKYNLWKSGNIAQGQHQTTNKPIPTVTNPTY